LFSVTRPWRIALAIVATSIVFSAAHYVGPQGEALEWFSASFRCFAGIFFATLFVYRGFGIAAGTHALYDVLVGLA
jgi:membrane protease YdiL (CAAX protease family)